MLEPRFEQRDAFTIAGVSVIGQAGQIDYAAVWHDLYPPVDALLTALSRDPGRYGASFDEGGQSVYLAGAAVPDDAVLPEEITKRRISTARYAIFPCTLTTMVATVQEVYGQWFSAAGYEPDHDRTSFEYYLPITGPGELRVDLYIPVKPVGAQPEHRGGQNMSVFDLISNRRSIRKYTDEDVPEETLRRILQAGILAPSGNNRQTWKFHVVRGNKRAEMVEHLKKGLASREKEGENTAGAKHSFDIMAQAPVTVFVFRPNRTAPWPAENVSQHFSDVVDVQSVGACIQNMLLMAEELGIGSLWICDVFSAYDELSKWLGESTEMIAAVCFGIADDHPAARKRKAFDDVVHWL